MHAENLLLLIDELDELSVVSRDLLTPRGLIFASFGVLAVVLGLGTGSLVLGACALFSGITAATLALAALDPAHDAGGSPALERETA